MKKQGVSGAAPDPSVGSRAGPRERRMASLGNRRPASLPSQSRLCSARRQVTILCVATTVNGVNKLRNGDRPDRAASAALANQPTLRRIGDCGLVDSGLRLPHAEHKVAGPRVAAAHNKRPDRLRLQIQRRVGAVVRWLVPVVHRLQRWHHEKYARDRRKRSQKTMRNNEHYANAQPSRGTWGLLLFLL